ncbi:GM20265 [Drosophila sechellia]|uniref:GM20265 n=1 Tax=Drosophila sechellia TaxID=7238 RepID=B4HQL1_DROSE|nr:GM20265 [Drosophila sechellia]
MDRIVMKRDRGVWNSRNFASGHRLRLKVQSSRTSRSGQQHPSQLRFWARNMCQLPGLPGEVHSNLQEASQEMKKVPKGREHRSMMGKISGAHSCVSMEQVSKSFRPTIAAGDQHPPKMRISKCDLVLVGFSHGCVCLWMKIKEP